MELNLLLRLIVAHLLTDFVLQPTAWVNHKKQKKHRSGKLYLHVLVAGALIYLFSGLWHNWWLPLAIMVSHFVIDLWKLNRPETLTYFLLDQLFHILVVIALWMIVSFNLHTVWNYLTALAQNTGFLLIVTGYVLVTWPLGYIIGMATEKWREAAEVNKEGLAKAGVWIGFFERLLILTFIISNQFAAVGFLIAAKSILRFSDKENTQKKTEYVLIGTLMSFAFAAIIGIVISKSL
ncbi:DUF3307 domain-containing protein [Mucilaginibacter sp. BT774]|uniref:DUF3307 domain-containing protein n=1 Tax=Mucilaginibacter sp. BT774 TaxID=3062276 RepID=UPI0026773051|nr:DUF3307 domain-containing protein [Mucilaginibacter sp. BT774]MDO3624701.1 DUF3307 domain-containing protein [Mucilaginibacter sp. BT774]